MVKNRTKLHCSDILFYFFIKAVQGSFDLTDVFITMDYLSANSLTLSQVGPGEVQVGYEEKFLHWKSG